MSGRLLHYTDNPITAVESRDQRTDRARHRGDKPNGLWVSVEGEDDWRSWCEAESFSDPSKQLCYEVILSPTAKILRITTEGDLLSFSHHCGFDRYAKRPGFALHAGEINAVAWDHIGATYDGIIIAPYQWACRLDHRTSWYYGWDCASGCLWNGDAVAALTLVASPSEVRA